MLKFIVTTTINKPTEAIYKFSKKKDWKMIVVGDKKTEHNLYKNIKNIIYLTPEDQINIDKNLSKLIGWNCIQRRNFGYIYAFKLGAEYIASIDDDNIPSNKWGDINIIKKKKIKYFSTRKIAFDPLSIFKTNEKIWHRGFPLQLIDNKIFKTNKYKTIYADIQANLWNGNPDIDAINRLSLREENYKFNNSYFYSSNSYMPFNSQNTIFSRKVIKNYFLFPFVGRMDDIWASYYVQSLGYKVMFGPSTVKQDRNLHNIYTDYKNETIGYNNNLNLLEKLKVKSGNIKHFLPERSYLAFLRYKKIMKQPA